MDEVWQEEQDQENESGIDMHDCYHACHPLEHNEQKQREQENGNS